MENAIDGIFQTLTADINSNLAVNEESAPARSVKELKGSGTIPCDFDLDANGNYHCERSKYGAGSTVRCTAWFDNPNATYNLTVKSSDGGGGSWANLKVKQQVHFDIETSLFHNTTITIDIHASVSNVRGHAEIEYSY